MKNSNNKPEWKIKREQQIQNRFILAGVIIADIIGFALFIGGCERVMAEETSFPVAGFTAYINSIDLSEVDVVEEEVEMISEMYCENEPEYSEEDLELLAHLIYAEAGADYIDDITLYYVGSVVINRMNSDMYPNTLKEVIYQKGQYACTWDGGMNKCPNERAYVIAEDILVNGSVLPGNVLGQSGFIPKGWNLYTYKDGIYFSCFN